MTGEKLKEKRINLGFTQEEFAKKLMVATNTVARWERGERSIPPYLAMALITLENELKGNNKNLRTSEPLKVKNGS